MITKKKIGLILAAAVLLLSAFNVNKPFELACKYVAPAFESVANVCADLKEPADAAE